jgi:deazaflavin-dependent oxidoreductase (nitroreductase family)
VSIHKTPPGTHGGRPIPGLVGKLVIPVMLRIHKRSQDRFSGMDLLYLTTVGAKSGQPRTTPVARFDDGRGGWYVVASAGGAVSNPAWYHNLAAHPDQVVAEFGGQKHPVAVSQLAGAEREAVWQQVIAAAPNFKGYESKTDREIPIIRLTPKA